MSVPGEAAGGLLSPALLPALSHLQFCQQGEQETEFPTNDSWPGVGLDKFLPETSQISPRCSGNDRNWGGGEGAKSCDYLQGLCTKLQSLW